VATLPLLVRDLPGPGPDQLFEITLEPRTGSPTGPILYKGLTAPTL
jgi:anti-sigma-K factor RskA